MGAGRALNAWGNKGRFTYVGGLDRGTKVLYGRAAGGTGRRGRGRGEDASSGKSFVVPAEVYAELLAHYAGQDVPIGASRQPPRDSLNAWLRKRLPHVEVPVAYVGPILVAEGAAERDGDALRVH